jgi:hypothetical protein
MTDSTGNLPPLPGIFQDYAAPIVRNQPAARELTMARWGIAHIRAEGPQFRFRRYEYSQRRIIALATLARTGPSLRRAFYKLLGKRASTRRYKASGLVRP